MEKLGNSLLILAMALIFQSHSVITKIFTPQQVVATIEDNRLIEASGLEESIKNPGYFWTHNDSDSEPILYLIDGKGSIKMEVELAGIENRDWEEIVTVKDGNESFIFIGEIGDNKAVHEYVSLIRIEEPALSEVNRITIPFNRLEIMNFQYAEGARDAEAVLYDYNLEEFVLVTKREENAMVYSFPFIPGRSQTFITSKGTLPARLFTAADMNEEGEILLKHYGAIYYWGSSNQSAMERILAWNPIQIDYIPEPQGEAICWFNRDFYTISEKNTGKPQEMLFFERLK
ncbi:hypothetical protein [Ekhidna sp.]|uniref:hypothetical protein n=1 Tax=Ekhidna sp. TaxID=2608089 RepID=UPI0032F07BAF